MIGHLIASRYQVLELLGSGGMASVFRALDQQAGREVALKVLAPALRGEQEAQRRFKAEHRILAALGHPGLPKVYEGGLTPEGLPFFAMELVTGESIAQAGLLGAEAVRALLAELLPILGHLHRRGLVHGDIKADNLMRGNDGKLRLMDFGLTGPAGSRPRSVEGTVTHMAPELIQRGKADRRSDLYALGVTLFRLLTERLPLEGPTPAVTLKMHLESAPPALGTLRPEVPAELEAVVMRLLSKRPQDRFQSTDELLQALGLPPDEGEQTALPLLSPFVGRQSLLGDLIARVGQTAHGLRTSPLLLVGEPGVGKTRLLEELGVQARLMDLPVVMGHGLREHVAFGPWLELSRELLALGHAVAPEAAGALQSALAPFTGDVPAQDAPQALRTALEGLVEALAADGGLVVMLDDWHLADSASQALLAHMVREGERLPVFWLVASSRAAAEFPGDEWPLPPLAPAHVAQLVAAHLGVPEAPESVARQLQSATAGNPRFVEELLRYMLSHGQLVKRADGWALAPGAEGALPEGIQALYAATWQELPEAAHGLLKLLAVAVSPLPVELIAAATGLPPALAEEAVSELTARNCLADEETPGTLALRDMAFGAWIAQRCDAEERTLLHQALADALTPLVGEHPPLSLINALAHHAQHGLPPGQALPWLERAARQNLAVKAFPECRRFARAAYDRGLALPPEARLELLDMLASAHRGLDEADAALAVAQQAVTLAEALDQPRLLARTLNGLGKIHQLASRYEEAARVFELAAQAAGSEAPLEMARSHRALARLAFFAGDAEGTYHHGSEALELVRAHAEAAERAEVLAEIGEMFQAGDGRLMEGLACLEEAQAIARELDDPHLESSAASGLGNLQLALGQLAAARVSFARACALFDRLGNVSEGIFARVNLALVAEEQGRFPEAARLAAHVSSASRATGRKFPMAVGMAIEGAALVHMGNSPEGLRLLEAATAVSEEIQHRYLRAIICQVEAPARVLLGQWDEAREAAATMEDFGLSAGAADLVARAALVEAEIRLETGLAREVEDLVASLASNTHAGVRMRASLLKAKAAMALGQGAMAYQALAQAGTMLMELDAPRQEAELLLLESQLTDTHGEDGGPLAEAAVKLLEESQQRHQLVRALGVLARFGPLKQRQAAQARARELVGSMSAALGLHSARYMAAFGRQALGREERPEVSDTPSTLAELRELALRLQKGLAVIEADDAPSEDVRQTRKRLDQVVDFAHVVNSILEVDSVVDRALSLIIEITGAERGLLLLREAKNLTSARYLTAPGFKDDGDGGEQYSRSVARTVLRTGETVCVLNALSDPRFAQQASVLGLNLQTIICVPLKDQAEVIGAIYVDRQELAAHFAKSDLETVQALASLTAQAIINARLMRAQEERRAHLEMLNRLHRTVARSLELDKVLDAVADMTIEFTRAERALILIAEGDQLVFGAGRDAGGPLPTHAARELSRSVCQKVQETHQAVYVFDTGDDDEFSSRRSVVNLKLGSVLAVPLMGQSGLIGILYVDSRMRALGAVEKELELLGAVANVAALAVENARLYHLATIDGMTGLYVRSFFSIRLDEEARRVRRYGGKFGLLVIDIDHFKKFNDTYGHQTGDEVIKLVADTIRDCIRNGVDIPGRYGGEELVVLLPETDRVGTEVVAERIRSRVEAAGVIGPDGVSLRVTVSIGVACFPQMGETGSQLFDHADQALYVSKRAGRNRWTVYQAESSADPTTT